MCGRYVLAEDPALLVSEFGADVASESFAHAVHRPNFNVAPTTMVPVIRHEEGSDPVGLSSHRVLDLVRWGITPRWAGGKSTLLVNARGESVAEKFTFKKSFEKTRCIIPATGYYEWKRPEKDPYFIYREGKSPMAMAGLIVTTEIDGIMQRACVIITLAAAPNIEAIHDRMPATISPKNWDDWLDPDVHGADALMLMESDQHLLARPVSRRVNSIRHNDASLIEPEPHQERLI